MWENMVLATDHLVKDGQAFFKHGKELFLSNTNIVQLKQAVQITLMLVIHSFNHSLCHIALPLSSLHRYLWMRRPLTTKVQVLHPIS